MQGTGLENPVAEAAHRLFSTTWFIVFGGLVATVYLAALLWKILKSDEGFLFGYGEWIVGKWQRSSAKSETQTERPQASRRQDREESATRKARRDIAIRQQELTENVLRFSRLLDGDLAYLMLNGDWDERILRAFQAIVSGITRVVQPAGRCRCGFFVLDDDQQYLTLAAGEGYSGALPRLAIEHSCAGRAYVTGENYYCRDVETDPVYWHSGKGRRESYRSIACIPVRTGPFVFGVLCLDAKEAGAFSAEDFTYLELFAAKLALFCAFHLAANRRDG